MGRSMTRLLLPLLLLAAAATHCRGANWAQLGGPRRTASAWPASTPWTRRWGLAVAVYQAPARDPDADPAGDDAAGQPPLDEPSCVWVLGGDDYVDPSTPPGDDPAAEDAAGDDAEAGVGVGVGVGATGDAAATAADAERDSYLARLLQPLRRLRRSRYVLRGSGGEVGGQGVPPPGPVAGPYGGDARSPAVGGGGGLRNDVWVWCSVGVRSMWRARPDYARPGPAGDPPTAVTSTVEWTRLGPEAVVPRSQEAGGDAPADEQTPGGYREWLCCEGGQRWYPCHTAAAAASCATAGAGGAGGAGSAGGAQARHTVRRWSPRRGHVAVGFVRSPPTPHDGSTPRSRFRLIVMGGRARTFERVGDGAAVGALGVGALDRATGAPSNASRAAPQQPRPPPRSRREATALMNDVWGSNDGEAWELVRGGCGVPSAAHSPPPGTAGQACTADGDCYARRLGDAACVEGMCVCRHWTPRERFAAAVVGGGGALVVSGGVARVARGSCGAYLCPASYPVLLRDVWASPDGGASWAQLTPLAPWPPRADHRMVYAPRLWRGVGVGVGVGVGPGDTGALLLLGGRGARALYGGGSGEAQGLQGPAPAPPTPPESSGDGTEGGRGAGGVEIGIDDEEDGGGLQLQWPAGDPDPHALLQDVHVSLNNGTNWTALGGVGVGAVPWPARAAFGAVLSGGRLWVMGGEVAVPRADPEPTPRAAAQARISAARAGIPGPRSPTDGTAVYGPARRFEVSSWRARGVVEGGRVAVGRDDDDGGGKGAAATATWAPAPALPLFLPVGDVWALPLVPRPAFDNATPAPPPAIAWAHDFAPSAPAHAYFHPHDALAAPRFRLNASAVAVLARHNVTTWAGLAAIPRAVVAAMRAPTSPRRLALAGVCALRQAAVALVAQCTVAAPAGGAAAGGGAAGVPLMEVVSEGRGTADVPSGTAGGAATGCEDAAPSSGQLEGLSPPSEVVCRQTFPPRAHFAAFALDGELFVVGGREGARGDGVRSVADVWVRDGVPPRTLLTGVPVDRAPAGALSFACDEPGCSFECAAWDVGSGAALREWSPCASPFAAGGLNAPLRATRLAVRAVDAAGNRDGDLLPYAGLPGQRGNTYEWTRVDPPPWLLIFLCLGCGALLLLVAACLYRRHVRRAALAAYLRKRAARRLRQARAVAAAASGGGGEMEGEGEEDGMQEGGGRGRRGDGKRRVGTSPSKHRRPSSTGMIGRLMARLDAWGAAAAGGRGGGGGGGGGGAASPLVTDTAHAPVGRGGWGSRRNASAVAPEPPHESEQRVGSDDARPTAPLASSSSGGSTADPAGGSSSSGAGAPPLRQRRTTSVAPQPNNAPGADAGGAGDGGVFPSTGRRGQSLRRIAPEPQQGVARGVQLPSARPLAAGVLMVVPPAPHYSTRAEGRRLPTAPVLHAPATVRPSGGHPVMVWGGAPAAVGGGAAPSRHAVAAANPLLAASAGRRPPGATPPLAPPVQAMAARHAYPPVPPAAGGMAARALPLLAPDAAGGGGGVAASAPPPTNAYAAAARRRALPLR